MLPPTPAGWPLVVDQTTAAPQPVTAGVAMSTSSLETVGGREQASVLDVDLGDPNVRLGVVVAQDRLITPDETLTSMAARTRAVGGINGDFFESGGPGRPINMVAIDGRLVQSASGYAVLGAGLGRRPGRPCASRPTPCPPPQWRRRTGEASAPGCFPGPL